MILGCTSQWLDGAQTRGETHQMLRDSTKIFFFFVKSLREARADRGEMQKEK